MAIDNLISISFSEEELKSIQDAISSINAVLTGKAVNLTPEERTQYGSIADRNKVLVDKCKAYMEQAPETLPRTVDKAEFDKDYAARLQLETPLRDLGRVMEKMRDTKTLLDHDNFHAAISYYRYVKYLSAENEPGTTSIYQDLRKHYVSSGSTSANSETPSSESEKTPQ